jgi:hypothetical protein
MESLSCSEVATMLSMRRLFDEIVLVVVAVVVVVGAGWES